MLASVVLKETHTLCAVWTLISRRGTRRWRGEHFKNGHLALETAAEHCCRLSRVVVCAILRKLKVCTPLVQRMVTIEEPVKASGA
jgi:hypothetical protein